MSSNFGILNRDLIGGNLYIKNKLVIDKNRQIKGKNVTVKDGVSLNGTCSNVSVSHIADEEIPAYRIVKVSDTTNGRVKQIKSNDNYDMTAVVGVSTSSASEAGDSINVATTGLFKIQMEPGLTVVSGNLLMKSDAHDGHAKISQYLGSGVFGVAMESVAPLPGAMVWTGSSDFDTESMVFGPVSNVSNLCFAGNGNGHSHGGDVTLTIELGTSPSTWYTVFSQIVPDNDELFLAAINVTFPTIASVDMIRISSDPGQSNTYHDMNNLIFNLSGSCNLPGAVIKATFIK